MKIYIVDYLGTHCGMHYYNDAFEKVLLDIPDTQTHILSNYQTATSKKAFFHFQYRGNILRKIGCLILNYLTLFSFVLHHQKDCFIYLTYGNRIDLPFMWIVSIARKHLIDIHGQLLKTLITAKALNACSGICISTG